TGIGDGFAWRYDGTAWRALTLPTELKNLSLFKVWGQRTDDVWLVGSLGAAGHWDGAQLTSTPTSTRLSLFTVYTNPARVVAVGGQGDGVLFERTDSASPWSD